MALSRRLQGKLIDATLALSGSVRVQFGSLDGDVSFAGLTLAGLYQINVKIPDGAPDGDVPVIVEINRQTSPGDVFLTVQKEMLSRFVQHPKRAARKKRQR